jgi:predicted CopG family antitoxin
MTATPLAEAYEKLKELRRQGDSSSDDVRSVLDGMRGEMVMLAGHLGGALTSEELVRTIEIRTLAERVFSDPAKADAWLSRPNRGLSGQRPLDLLKDELGTAVVREMLERIDHGIFA